MFSNRFCCNSDSNKSCLILKKIYHIYLFNEFNSFSSDTNNDPENVINSNYYDIDQLQTLKEFTDKSSVSLFDWNNCSLSKNIDNFEHLIQSTKTDSKTLKTLWPLFIDGVQLCQGYRATSMRQFTFYHQVPRKSWYSFDRPQKDERVSRPWSHPVVLNMGPLNWKYSTLTTRLYFDIIAASESRINKNKLPPIDISIPNYSYEFCPTEAMLVVP